jgi:5'-nucleotidase
LKAFLLLVFSLSDYEWNADFESIKPFIHKITMEVLKTNFKRCFLNVNFPKLKRDDIKGIKSSSEKHSG